MIKATGRIGDGDALLLLGLSRRNVERLLAGQPMKIYGQDVGMPGLVVVIVGGDTEESIQAELTRTGLLDEGSWQVPQ